MKIPSSRVGRSARRSSSSEEDITELDPSAMFVSFEQEPVSGGWIAPGEPPRLRRSSRPLLPYELPISKFYNNYESAGERRSREESLSELLSLSASLEGILAGGGSVSRASLSRRMDEFVAGSVDSVLLDCLEDELPSVDLHNALELDTLLSLGNEDDSECRRTTRANTEEIRTRRLSEPQKVTEEVEPESEEEDHCPDDPPKRRKSTRKK